MNNQNLIPVFNGKISNSETLLCVVFPFAKSLDRTVDLVDYLKQAAPLPDDELHWQAWQMSQSCRDACFKKALSHLMR